MQVPARPAWFLVRRRCGRFIPEKLRGITLVSPGLSRRGGDVGVQAGVTAGDVEATASPGVTAFVAAYLSKRRGGRRPPPSSPGRGGNPELICPFQRREGAASAWAQTRSSPDAPNKHSRCAVYRTLIPQATVLFGPVGHPGTFEIKGSRLHF